MTVRVLKMPQLGETMVDGLVVSWLIEVGQSFARGQPIVEFETDKTVVEYPALGKGLLVEKLAQEGDRVAVGAPIGKVDIGAGPDWTNGEAGAADDGQPTSGQATDSARQAAATSLKPDSVPPTGAPEGADTDRGRSTYGGIRATPLARRLARENGIDIAGLTGTGRRGRIEKTDVLAALEDGVDRATATDGTLFAEVAEGQIAYTDVGPKDGPVYLLLHGYSGDKSAWAALAAGLKNAGMRAVAPDLPGHGQTTIDTERVEGLEAGLAAFVEQVLPGRPVHLVAHSLGAVAAVGLASKAAGRAAELTLIAPAGIGRDIDTDFIQGMANAGSAGELTHLLRRLSVLPLAYSDVALQAIVDQVRRGRLLGLAGNAASTTGQKVDILRPLADLSRRMRVRVLIGLQDRIIPAHHATALPPRVATHYLAQSGHMPQWDQVRDVLDLLLPPTDLT